MNRLGDLSTHGLSLVEVDSQRGRLCLVLENAEAARFLAELLVGSAEGAEGGGPVSLLVYAAHDALSHDDAVALHVRGREGALSP